MDTAIVVKPKSRAANLLARLRNAIFNFFATVGESILKAPNQVFYTVLVIVCVLIPYFSVVLMIALLCGIYRRHGA